MQPEKIKYTRHKWQILGTSPCYIFALVFLFFLFKRYFTHLFGKGRERVRERNYKQGEWEAKGEGEADSSLSREPHAGIHPRTLGSGSELKVDV